MLRKDTQMYNRKWDEIRWKNKNKTQTHQLVGYVDISISVYKSKRKEVNIT